MKASAAGSVVHLVRLSAVAGLLIAAMVLVTVGGGAVAARDAARSALRMPDAFDPSAMVQQSVLLDADGREFATVHDRRREAVRLDEVAPVMRAAVLAVEDRRFYEHSGLDLRAVFRAALATLEGRTQGGSTITQQYVKNVLVEAAETPEEAARATETTLARKIRELRYALGVEAALPKDRILEGYLNISYFGNGAYGVQAAAQRYFGVDAADLSAAQAATLAGLVKGPSVYDPVEHPEKALDRRATVLSGMADVGVLTEEDARRAADSPLGLDMTPLGGGCYDSDHPYFCTYVLSWIENDPRFGEDAEERARWVRRAGLTIRTTLDPGAQRAAQRAVDRHVPRGADAGKVAVQAMVEPGTGDVVAMAQNREFGFDGQDPEQTSINFAVDAGHGGGTGFQAGSVFKAYTVAAALEERMGVGTSFKAPDTLTVKGQRTCSGKRLAPWSVRNAGDSDAGRQDMVEGTKHSSNTYFAQLQKRVGLCDTVRMAERLGAKRADGAPFGQWNSFTLGDQEVAPLDVAGSYATLAARGVRCAPRPVAVITPPGGERREVGPTCERVLERSTADAVNDVLRAPLTSGGTAQGLSPGRPAAGKTGTTDGSAAAWFAGHTPDLASAVAVGDPRGGARHPLRGVSIGGRYHSVVYGATLPGPIWRDGLRGALEGTKERAFPDPRPSALRPGFGVGPSSRPDSAVPDVRGRTFTEAEEALEDAGYRVREGGVRVPSDEEEGAVASTNPSAGTPLPEGAVVNVFRARG
ncbi:penicillin-binding protein [Nocardiopsis suaedae]|uniref:Penicillin-binding protein n=1 Tax=Nocardiopsis suaedae TaxID=3018444 RepID=A0ABT4TM93_9ACTN|nr:penicillin-binding protein [Nocardiopsis suaedae]MDA2805826.1 penicillin-binding protein [Nocardiopsis suaedae]